MFGLPGHLELLVVVGMLVVIIWPSCRVVRKAGFPPLLGLLVAVPLANVALLLYLAFAEWPALRTAHGPGSAR